jgi:hypothetical protein
MPKSCAVSMSTKVRGSVKYPEMIWLQPFWVSQQSAYVQMGKERLKVFVQNCLRKNSCSHGVFPELLRVFPGLLNIPLCDECCTPACGTVLLPCMPDSFAPLHAGQFCSPARRIVSLPVSVTPVPRVLLPVLVAPVWWVSLPRMADKKSSLLRSQNSWEHARELLICEIHESMHMNYLCVLWHIIFCLPCESLPKVCMFMLELQPNPNRQVLISWESRFT